MTTSDEFIQTADSLRKKADEASGEDAVRFAQAALILVQAAATLPATV